jgi:hypothetical protein
LAARQRPNSASVQPNPDVKKPPEGGFQIRGITLARSAFSNYFDAPEAAAMAAVAAPMALVAAPEAASATPEAAAAVEDAASATDEAAAATDEAAEAAESAAGAAVSVLVQAARAAIATREANRSDLFMNFLEEKFWVRTITGNQVIRPHGGQPIKRQQAKLEHFLCLAGHYTHPYGTFSQSQCRRRKTRATAL